jgi:hypothetical protein
MEESKEDLTKRLAENQKRLDELGADKKSARKRILGQISKIKAQLDGRRPKEGNGETKKRKVRVDEVRACVCVCVCVCQVSVLCGERCRQMCGQDW